MLLYFCKLSVNVVYVKCPVSVFLSVSMSMSVSVPQGCSGLCSWPCSCSRSCVHFVRLFSMEFFGNG
jgi:hypothetical protein